MTLQAGGNVELRRLLRAASRGVPPFATGGSIEIDAGGTVVGLPRARIDVRGGRGGTATAGGQVQVTGALGVTLVDEIRAAGSKGGSVEITSVAGDILLEEAISTRGEELEGGPILIAAGGEVTTVETIAATGNLAGGSVSILAGGALNLDTIAARGIEGTAGSITVASAFGTVGADRLRADGQNGGSITLFSGDAAHADLLLARGVHDGGLISVDAVGDVSITDVDATGDVGGTVVVESSGGFIACDGVDVSGSDAGGSATLDAAAEILAGGELAASGGGGEIRLRGTAIPGIADVDVSSRGITAGGLLLVESTVGEVLMDDDYDATGSPGGTIQVEAAGNLTASGDFTVAAGGCIGLSAGGTLETSGGTFDIPVTPTCGASPSGAFLDGILMY
jgi:hypothetical protein